MRFNYFWFLVLTFVFPILFVSCTILSRYDHINDKLAEKGITDVHFEDKFFSKYSTATCLAKGAIRADFTAKKDGKFVTGHVCEAGLYGMEIWLD